MTIRQWIIHSIHKMLDLLTHAAAWLGYRLHPTANPKRYGVVLIANVSYKESGDKAHLLDIYRPRSDNLLPALMYVHGGGFSMCSKDTHRIFALVISSQNYVVFNINYRIAPKHRYPAALEDAASALIWVTDHAAQYGADSNRLVIAGESAGGNLTAALAYIATHPCKEDFARRLFERNPGIKAVAPIYGIHDLNDIPRLWRKPGKARKMSAYVKTELEWCAFTYVGNSPESAPLAHPLLRYSEPKPAGSRPLPPFFLTAGTADPLLDDSRRLHAAIEAQGGVSELHIYPGEIHGFNAMLGRPAAKAMWNVFFEFLSRSLREPASPAV